MVGASPRPVLADCAAKRAFAGLTDAQIDASEVRRGGFEDGLRIACVHSQTHTPATTTSLGPVPEGQRSPSESYPGTLVGDSVSVPRGCVLRG
jgi:hypothetical protein